MINAIGEATIHQFVRASYNAVLFDKNQENQKTDKIKAQRPVEQSDDGQKSEMNLQSQETVKTRNNLDEGKLVVEKYDADGKLIKMTPPGFLPFGETA